MSAEQRDLVAIVEEGFRACAARRLKALDARADNAEQIVALEIRAQDHAQRAADALARGDRDDGVLLLTCALVDTEEIDHLELEGAPC